MKIKKLRIHNAFTNILSLMMIFLMLVTSNSMWLLKVHRRIPTTVLRFTLTGIILISCILPILSNPKKLSMPKFIRCLFVAGMASVFAVTTNTNRTVYMKYALVIIIAGIVYFSVIDNPEKIWNLYTDVVVCICIMSLIFYVFGSILHIIKPTGVFVFSWGDNVGMRCSSYFNIYFEPQRLDFFGFKNIVRNSAFFPEATMFSFVISIALGHELLVNPAPDKRKCIILTVTALSTTATLGMMTAVMVYVFRYIARIMGEKKISLKNIGILCLAGAGILLVKKILDYKTTTDRGEGSMEVRMDHVVACLKAFSHNPAFGVGYNNLNGVLRYAQYKQGISVGLLYTVACGGIVMLIVYMYPLMYYTITNYRHKNYNHMFYGILIFILIFVNAITNTTIILLMIGYMTAYMCRSSTVPEKMLSMLKIRSGRV
ncbi:MAG: hypothetical protein K2G36_04855 [Ruminococcus sp.]|nr:hypothetical protein [Ruminococcus sp.]